MKKFGLFMVGISVFLVLCTGCSPENKPQSGEEGVNPVVEPQTEKKEEAVLIKPSALPDMTSWTEVSRYTGDVDGDGTDENIVLSTSASRDEKGEIHWDDGQKWALYVDDRGESFVFLNEYVQLGSVYFEVSDYYMKDGAEPRINVFVSTGAGLRINGYSFNKNENGYKAETIYDTGEITEGGINRRFSSFEDMNKEDE